MTLSEELTTMAARLSEIAGDCPGYYLEEDLGQAQRMLASAAGLALLAEHQKGKAK